MDDLLAEFLTETGEQLDELDTILVRFERETDDAEMLNAIFRLFHTIKGTCGFFDLDRLAQLAHAAEALMGRYRDGAPVSVEGVSVVLASVDRIKGILAQLERDGVEPQGSDDDLIGALQVLTDRQEPGPAGAAQMPDVPNSSPPVPDLRDGASPVHDSLDALEQAWQGAPGSMTNAAASAAPEFEPASECPPERDPADERASALPDREPASLAANGADNHVARMPTVRVAVDTLENLMTTVSELVLTRNELLDIARRTEESVLTTPLQRLSAVTVELQEAVMKARMQPIANAWQKLPLLVRTLSLELGKRIEIEAHGGDNELDRQVLEAIKDPLTHMVRNAADHGLETPDERVRAGKPETGTIALRASQQGGVILIEVADDGRGLDVQAVRAKAIEQGLSTQGDLDRMSDTDILNFIFKPGFSTARTVSEISGRGVGMDVVRSNIESIGGTVNLVSTSREGTVFVIKIPLTLAIMSALIVEVAGVRFAIPQFGVAELVRTGDGAGHPVELINDTAVLRLRDELLPLLDFAPLLGLRERDVSRTAEPGRTAVVMQAGAHLFGVLVDKVFRTEEIVVKPLSSVLRPVDMFSGNTILGDGSVIMIVDPVALAEAAGPVEGRHDAAETGETTVADQNRTALLLFRAADTTLKAVPLSLITRLEEVAPDSVECCDGQDVIQYRGALLPLFRMGDEKAPRPDTARPVLVFTEGAHAAGLIVDEIVDIVEEPLTIDLEAKGAGIAGSAIVRGEAVEIVDVSYVLGSAFSAKGPAASARRDGPPNVLLAEQSQFFRDMLAPLLRGSGYAVTTAASAQEVLALKDEGRRFDVVVSDIDMPGLDGLALAAQLKADPEWNQIPLVALSSQPVPRLAEKGREAGFESIVGKFDRRTLMQVLQDCLDAWEAAA